MHGRYFAAVFALAAALIPSLYAGDEPRKKAKSGFFEGSEFFQRSERETDTVDEKQEQRSEPWTVRPASPETGANRTSPVLPDEEFDASDFVAPEVEFKRDGPVAPAEEFDRPGEKPGGQRATPEKQNDQNGTKNGRPSYPYSDPMYW